ncbi:10666_t:CDS:2, partial [Funneliformis geosporum]
AEEASLRLWKTPINDILVRVVSIAYLSIPLTSTRIPGSINITANLIATSK